MVSYIYFCRVWDVVNTLKISEYIKSSLDSVGRMELEQAMMFVCMAVDGTAKKEYPNMPVGSRFRKFINNNLEIVELMFGGINLQETRFPLKNKKGMRGMTFAEILRMVKNYQMAMEFRFKQLQGVNNLILTQQIMR